jgi:hypothetical protein
MRRLMVVLAIAVCVGMPAPAGATGTLDQQQTIAEGLAQIFGGLSRAQTFTPALSGGLDQVDLYLGQDGGSGPLTVEIRDVSGGAPGSTVLASASVPAGSVPNFGSSTFVSVPFASPAALLAGSQYAIVAYFDDNSHAYYWSFANADVYPGGAAFTSPATPPTTWSPSDNDFAFRTYVVVSNQPPNCAGVSASPAALQSASRGQFRTVELSGATDPDGDSVSFHIDAVTQDEPVTGMGDNTFPDAEFTAGGADSNQVRVRAERDPKNNGRVYRIAYTVSDGRGGSCDGIAKVGVPRKKSDSAVDDGDTNSWDSFTGFTL